MPLNRITFQALAELRLEEANALLSAGYASGAYYLSGYAVECALKACICRLTNQYDFPPEKAVIEKVYRHDSKSLLQAARLDVILQADRDADPDLDANWTVIAGWDVIKRYEQFISHVDASEMMNALTEPTHGVMQWLRKHW